MNWKIRKPDCCNIQNSLKDFLALLSMESAASTLKDYDSGQGAPWTLIRQYMSNRIII